MHSKRKTGPIGFIVGLLNIKQIYDTYIATSKLKFIPLYKFSQDHLELFFSACRSGLGNNNNPTDRQFRAVYKKLLVHCQLKDTGIGNCIPLEEIHILQSTPKNTERFINESSGRLRHLLDLDEDNFISYLDPPELHDHDYLFNPGQLTEFKEQAVKYIAGFIVFFLTKRLKCAECLNIIEDVDHNDNCNLISLKSRGRLKHPSQKVFKICLEAEKQIRLEIHRSSETKILKDNIITKITLKIIYEVILNNYFADDHDSTHLYNLIKSIIEKYITVRMHHIANQQNKRISLRSLYNKLILFQGM